MCVLHEVVYELKVPLLGCLCTRCKPVKVRIEVQFTAVHPVDTYRRWALI